jgi:transposase
MYKARKAALDPSRECPVRVNRVGFAMSAIGPLTLRQQTCRMATRYDKLAASYLAFIKLASIRLWLRTYESTP